MSAYSNMPWINAVRAAGGSFQPVGDHGSPLRGWKVMATIGPDGWSASEAYRNVHAVESDFSRNNAERLADRLNKGYNR